MSRRNDPVGALQEHGDVVLEDGRHITAASYVLTRNTRPDSTKAGTRAVSVVCTVGGPADRAARGADPQGTDARVRAEAEATARTRAVAEWEKRWGPLPWDYVEAVVAHLTMQVIYCLQVMPEDR